MKKPLTHLHLLFEREDLHFIASEIVKYYGLSSRVKIKKGRYKKEKGFYHWHDDTIHIDPNQSSRQFIITILHEIKHALDRQKMGADAYEEQASMEYDLAMQGKYGSKAKSNPYDYVPTEVEAEKWAQKEYRRYWKNKF